MNNKKKKQIMGLGFLLLLVVLSFMFYSVVLDVTSAQECIENEEGQVLCFDVSSKQPIGAFDLSSTAFSNAELSPGDQVKIGLTLDLQLGDSPINTFSSISIYREDGTRKASWQVGPVLNNLLPYIYTDTSKYAYGVVTFNVDDEAGKFKVVADIKGNQGRVIDDDIKYYTVKATPVECPDSVSTSWSRLESDETKVVEKRTHTTYSSAPECSVRTSVEYKTTCSAGYYIDGKSESQTLYIGDFAKQCLLKIDVAPSFPDETNPDTEVPSGNTTGLGENDAGSEGDSNKTGFWASIGNFFVNLWNGFIGLFSN